MKRPEDIMNEQLSMPGTPAGFELVQALQANGWHLVSDVEMTRTPDVMSDTTEIRATVQVDDEVIDSRKYVKARMMDTTAVPEYLTKDLERSVKQAVLHAVGDVLKLEDWVVS